MSYKYFRKFIKVRVCKKRIKKERALIKLLENDLVQFFLPHVVDDGHCFGDQ